MTLEDLLMILDNLAKTHGIPTPYIVGGVPRNIVLGQLNQIKDVDITNGDDSIDKLAALFANKLNKELKDTGKHKSVNYGGVSFDFSTNFTYGNIEELLEEKKISGPTNLMKEAYSRDFTTNTLLLDLNLNTIIDITGRGRDDTKAKLLECPVDCSISFISDPKRMLRAFHFKALYGYRFSDNVKNALIKNANLLETIKPQYSRQILNNIMKADSKVLDDMIEIGLMKYLPLTKDIVKVLLEKRKILDVL